MAVEGYAPVVCAAKKSKHKQEAVERKAKDSCSNAGDSSKLEGDALAEEMGNFLQAVERAPKLTQAHFLTHDPANPVHCEACRMSKLKRKPTRRIDHSKKHSSRKTARFSE